MIMQMTLPKRSLKYILNCIDGRPNYKGGHFRINLLPTTCHVYFGSMTGATPDGRLAHEPLSEGISPVQGADTKGPTAVIKSAAKIDHIRTGGTLLNQKFTPHLMEREEDLDKIVKLIRTYFSMNGHHIQFNVVDAATLRDAQKHPDAMRTPTFTPPSAPGTISIRGRVRSTPLSGTARPCTSTTGTCRRLRRRYTC